MKQILYDILILHEPHVITLHQIWQFVSFLGRTLFNDFFLLLIFFRISLFLLLIQYFLNNRGFYNAWTGPTAVFVRIKFWVILDGLKHAIVVLSTVPFLNAEFLLHQDFVHYILFVFTLNLFYEILWNVRVVLDQVEPILSSDEEAFANCEGFIDEMASLVEGYAVSSNEVAVLVPQNILFGPVDLKTNFISTIVEENDLIHFVELFE